MSTNLRTTDRLFICHSSFVIHDLFIVYCLLSTFLCAAQEKSEVLKYARTVVDTLASPSMHGRGYVLKGDSIAADYIKNEFEKFKLEPVGKEFYQKFDFPVNTFPGNVVMYLSCNQDSFKFIENIGKHYLVNSNSPTYIGNGSVVYCDDNIILSDKKLKKFKRKNFSRKIILINESKVTDKNRIKLIDEWLLNPPKAKGIIIETKEKLNWEVSQTQINTPIFISNNYGWDCRKKMLSGTINIDAKFIPDYQSQNVIGRIKGTQYPDSFIVFTAHYDHLGMMGKDVYFPGANDNASGCAMLLNLAKYYSKHPPKYSVAFMAFGAEEVGLLGSKYYVEHPLFPLNQIKFLVNFDIVGTGNEGIKVVNATEHKKEFDELVKINSEKNLLPSIQPREKAAISDHYLFEEAGVKTFYIYTLGGIKAYHDIYDRAETLPLTKFEELYKLVIDFTDTLQD